MKTVSKEASITTKNISALVFLKAAQYPFLAVFIMVIPRMMGAETYGKYALFISIITIASSLISLGLTEIFGRYLPEFEARSEVGNMRKLSSNILSLKIVLEILAAVALFLLLAHFYGGRFPTSYLLILAFVLPLRDLQSVTYAILFGLNKMGKFASRDLMRRVMSLTFTLILFHYYGLIGAMISFLLVDGAITITSMFWTKEYFRLRDFKIDRTFLRPVLQFGFLFYLGYGIVNVWYRAGNPLIDHFTNETREIALFDLPCQIFLITVAFINISVGSLAPIFTKMVISGREDKLIKWSKLAVKYTSIFCILVFAGYILMGRVFISLLIGEEFADIFPNGVVLLAGLFPITFAHVGYVFSIVYNKPMKYLQALLVSVGAFFVFSVILIPRMASMGCSIALSLSSFVYAFYMGWCFREILYPCLEDYLRMIPLGAVILPLILLREDLSTNICLTISFMLIYPALLLYAKVLNLEEIKEVYRALKDKSVYE